ncbi:MAG: undecaprenyldiphospho-muramoylpentapeptide beta-N-acetylglucosaminyltransferase [Bacillota bacterium]|nr:undecaprenyldiphospho-muramoylpentapeptide beta-N-acetylglucosaminyltransferase [Bacillota bacterium]
MKYLISGGGTGGHIYPALAILDEIKTKDPEAEFLYVGRRQGLEKELAQRAGYAYKAVRIKGLPRRLNLDSLKTAIALFQGIHDARKIIKDFKPDIVIGTGGYVSFPAVFVAQQKGIPTVLQEANAFPGKVNRILSKKADGIALAFEEAKNRLKSADKAFISGNPIRPEFLSVDKKSARQKFSIKEGEKLILSFGGSGGQESINDALIEIFQKPLKEDYRFIHITGRDYYQEFLDQIKEKNIKLTDQVTILDYSHQIPDLLGAADVAILSSSAISLAEVACVGLASILIPKTYTADNHQEYNARAFESAGASLLILEKDLNGQKLIQAISSIVDDQEKMQKMAKCAKILSKPNSTKDIVENIFRLLREKNDR